MTRQRAVDSAVGISRGRLGAFLAAILALTFQGSSIGAPSSAKDAGDVVAAWLRLDASPLQETVAQTVRSVDTFTNGQGVTIYYVANLDPEGFVIVAADDLVEPIVGFAPAGQFDPSPDNPLIALVSRDMPDRLAFVKGVDGTKAAGGPGAARRKWEQFRAVAQKAAGVAMGVSGVSDVRVAALLQSTWNQQTAGGNACYNYYTPPGAVGAAANYPCGCVATAMAQLMRYWQYPVSGVGTGAFSISVNGGAQTRNLRGGDGAGGAYVWTDMVLTPDGSTTLSQRQAIGGLCFDAGVAVNMSYRSSGSGAYTLSAKNAFVGTFGYSNAVYGYSAGTTIGAGLNGMINPNLDSGHPVLLGITDGSSGHEIVCDGYGYELSTLYHHLNLGWGGSYTAWYNLPTIDAGGYNFDTVDECVYNVWTNGTGEIISGRVTDSAGSAIPGAVVSATRTAGGTYCATTDVHGIYAFAKIPSSSQYTIVASNAGCNFTNQVVSTGLSADNAATSGNRWGVDFASADPDAPVAFSATPAGPDCIDLSWARNASDDDVLVAWNTNSTFGAPAGTYTAGDAISGGGTVLCDDAATGISHTGLVSGTKYYYRAWSVLPGPGYSAGVDASATTVRAIPFTEGFEHGGSIPDGWTQEYVTNTVDWSFQNGGHSSHPASAHGGSYNAFLYTASMSAHKTRLITPMLNFGATTQNVQLTFWHCMTYWAPCQDELRLSYRTTSTGAWTTLATYTSNVASWTQRVVSLPNATNNYYIAFEGNAKYGYGVCIDDVQVENLLQQTLTVVSAHGGAYPGTVTTNSGYSVTERITNSPVGNVGTQYVCAGAVVDSNAYAQVATTNVTLTLTNGATLTWLWTTNYQLTTAVNSNGTVSMGTGWKCAGSNVTVTATASNGWHFSCWTGGVTSTNIPLDLSMTQACSVVATFAINTYAITAGTGTNGTVSPTGVTMVAHGGSQTYAITPDANYHTVDVLADGVSVGAGTNYTFTAVTNAHTIAGLFDINTYALSVASLYGAPVPAGVTTAAWNTAVSASVAGSPVTGGGTQYVCTGWAGSGSVPASGTATNTSFNLTTNSSLTWRWATNFWLDASPTGAGSVSVSPAWFRAGTNVTVTASASNEWAFVRWTGDLVTNANPLALTMSRAYTLVAEFSNRPPPVVAVQPQSQTNNPGTAALFIVAVTNSPMAFQWQKNGTNVAGATASNYVIAAVQEANEGSYRCLVTNLGGAATSDVASLVVNDPAAVSLANPTNAAAFVAPADFTLAANASDADGTVTQVVFYAGASLLGSDGSSPYTCSWLSVPTGTYAVTAVAWDDLGLASTSAAVTVTVCAPPVITSSPASQTNYLGRANTFTVGASGGALCYQWQKGGTNIGGATGAGYIIGALALTDAGSYRCVVTNVAGVATSGVAVLTVTNSPSQLDLNNDGNADILLQSTANGALFAWYLNGHGSWTNMAYIYNGSLAGWNVVGTADYNSDGNADILLQSTANGALYAWYLNGHGSWTNTAYIYNGSLSGWNVVGTADYNSDGNADILLQSTANGALYAWYLNGHGSWTNTAYIYNGSLAGWSVVGGADYNNDGNADILLQSTANGALFVWYLNGHGSWSSMAYIYNGSLSGWNVVGTGDYNSDGNADILLQSTANGALYVWYMDGHGNLSSSGYLYNGSLSGWRSVGGH